MANGIQKDLGKVTAYSYAKAAGYTGTEEQFQAVFNEFTENAPGLITRMDTAVERAEAAVTNIDATIQDAVDDAVEEATASAVATANQAVTDAQAAQTAAEGAVTQANNAVTQANAAVTAAQAAQSAAEDAAESFVLDRTLTDSGAAAPADLVGDLKESFTQIKTKNLINPESLIEGSYINPSNGNLVSNSASSCLDYTEIQPNFIISANANIGNQTTVRYAVYDENKTYISGGTLTFLLDSGTNRYYVALSVDNSAKYVRFSMANTVWNGNYQIQIENGTTPTAYEEYIDDYIKLKEDALPDNVIRRTTYTRNSLEITADSMADGDSITIQNLSSTLKQRFQLAFKCNVTSFARFKIGSSTTYITVGTTALTLTSNGTSQAVYHQLTIANNMSVVIKFDRKGKVFVELFSNGQMYQNEFSGYINSGVNTYMAWSDESTVTDCKLSWACQDIDKKIWILGDSYVGYNTARWFYYLTEDGYDQNALVMGYAGLGSVAGLPTFESLLQYGTPDIAVYMWGMNDGSDPNVSPSTWRTPREQFIEVCEKYGIEPVFELVPTVPTVKNDAKNAWVKENGYRYIDFYGAVGADSEGNWYEGMLSSDGVHPTELGAKALYGEFLVDLPEIIKGSKSSATSTNLLGMMATQNTEENLHEAVDEAVDEAVEETE